jgi:hypothetical protein
MQTSIHADKTHFHNEKDMQSKHHGEQLKQEESKNYQKQAQ